MPPDGAAGDRRVARRTRGIRHGRAGRVRRARAEGPARPAPRAARGGARGGARRRRHRAVVGGGRHPHPRHRAPVPAAGHGPHRAAVPGAPAAVGGRPGRGRVRLGSGRRPATVSPGCCSSTGSPGWRPAARRGRAGPPGAATPVLDPDAHLRIAVPWLCSTLRAVTGHLDRSGKPAAALDAMLVCHVAGCSRVTGSASGVPQAGEAGCDERCAALVRRYLDAVHGLRPAVRGHSARRHRRDPAPTAAVHRRRRRARPPPGPAQPTTRTTPGPDLAPAGLLDPHAWTGGPTGCTLPDPTGGRCVTGATRHGLARCPWPSTAGRAAR